MKAIKFNLPEGESHPAIEVFNEAAFKTLLDCECILVDGEDKHYKNRRDTVVIALPEFGNSSRKENESIHEWIDSMVDGLLGAVAELRADEFEIQPLEGVKGYSRIVRLWWD